MLAFMKNLAGVKFDRVAAPQSLSERLTAVKPRQAIGGE
jgi:hypothetical protein